MKKYELAYSERQDERKREISRLKKNPILPSLYINKDKTVSELVGIDYKSFGRLIDDNGVFISGNVITANQKNEKIVALVLGDNVVSIGEGAFSGCKDLKFFQAGASLKTIANRAFSSCDSLKYIELNDGLEEIGNKAFYRCYAVHEGILHIPGTVKKFGKDVFSESSVERIITTKEVAENYIKTNKESKALEIIAVEEDKLYYYKITKSRSKNSTVRRRTCDWPYGLEEADKVYGNTSQQLFYYGSRIPTKEIHKLSPEDEWQIDPQFSSRMQSVKNANFESQSLESSSDERLK